MMRILTKSFLSVVAAASMAVPSLVATAGDLGLVVNGDIETVSRFDPHGVPGADHPNGFADGWHHSSNATWSNGTTDPVVSGIHALLIVDDNVGGVADVTEEHRSFATEIPGVGNAGRNLTLSWNWNWDITSLATDTFSATVRISDAPVVGLDLVGNIVDHVFQTGVGNSGGYQAFLQSISLSSTDASFDIIFKSEDRVGAPSETGRLLIDDVSAVVPEPASLILLSLGGLAISRRPRRN